MNIRLIKYWLCGTLLTLASCADEELVQSPTGNYKDGDLVTLNFTVSVPRAEEVVMTRAAVDEDKVEDLTLLVFSGQEGTAKLEQVVTTYSGTEFETSELEPLEGGNRYKFAAPLTASTEAKAIYIIANAGYLLTSRDDDDFNLKIGTTTVADLNNLQTYENPPKFIMSGCKVLPIPHADLLTEDFPLYRCNAKVTVEVDEAIQDKFQLESFYLCNAQQYGSIVAYQLYVASTGLPTAIENPDEDVIEYSEWLDFVSKRMKKNDEAQYPTPTANRAVSTEGKNTKVFLLVKGTYDGDTYYYHADFKTDDGPLDVRPNHHYKVTITAVDRIGYANSFEGFKGAIDGAENMAADIKDIEPTSHNMASDGVTEIGVESDTLYIKDTEANTEVEFKVTVSPSILNDDNTVNASIVFDYPDAETWLTLSADNLTNITENKGSYSITTCTLKTRTANPAGERREARVGISCRGVMTYVTVIQEPEFCADQFGTVTVKVKECDRNESNWEATNWQWLGNGQSYNYWDFIRGTDGTTDVKGILPDDMGGKVRTEGFHAPMSDFQQFVYTFTVPSGEDYAGCQWHIELDADYQDKLLFWTGDAPSSAEPRNDGKQITSFEYGTDQQMNGQKFTFTNNLLDLQNNGNITQDAYRYGKDAFRIVVTRQNGTEEVYAYDLYHTGVFNYDDGNSDLRVDRQDKAGWYYYEVILMGSNYWLDRNLGATSSAYYVKEGDQGDADAAGGLYRIAGTPVNGAVTLVGEADWEEIAPKGFRVPTMTEFRALTSDRRFCQEMEGGYWGARYDTGKPDQGTVYFPKNGMWYGGAASGSGSTGYYWTQTEALGASGNEQGYWLQNMQLAGSNASGSRYRICESGTNVNSNPTGMSVRCVYNSRVVETQHEYECYVKGYTHVFLYNDEGGGNRTYLNAWPGDMICIYDPNALSMYHPFTFSSMVEYNNLKVVFNVVDNEGKVIDTYPENFQTAGGLDLKESDKQTDKFFHKGGTDWTYTAE